MVDVEVVVVGGGPAGSVAGSLLARCGHRVIALEAGTFPRFQIGESLLPRCNDILDEAGLLPAVVSRRNPVKNAARFLAGAEREAFLFCETFPRSCSQTVPVRRGDFYPTLATAVRAYSAQ